MPPRPIPSTTPLFVLSIVFSSLGTVCALIVAPLLAFLLGLWLAAKIVFVVGAVFGFVGFVFWMLVKRIQETGMIATFLNSHRRSKVSRLARELGVTVFKAEMLISKCVSKGLVEGYFDRGSGEFFTTEAFLHQLNIQECSNCSAPVSQLRLIGEQCRCEACGRAIEYSWKPTEIPS
jgi:hypothetical protein